MTPERIAELRKRAVEIDHEFGSANYLTECLNEIELHQENLTETLAAAVDAHQRAEKLHADYRAEASKCAALTKCMRDVAAALRSWCMSPAAPMPPVLSEMAAELEAACAATYGRADHLHYYDNDAGQRRYVYAGGDLLKEHDCDECNAHKYVPETPLPLSPASRAKFEEMARKILDEPKRVELGCQSGGCFCTGRCKRTQEEEDVYQKQQREFSDFLGGERSRKCMDCGGEAKPAFGTGYRPDAPITSSMVVCHACRDKAVAEPDRCNAMHTGERCIKTREHDGWHQQPGRVCITWPDPEPHETARELVERLAKERDEAQEEAVAWKDTAERVSKNLTAEVEKLRGELANENEMHRIVLAHLKDVGFDGPNDVIGVSWLKDEYLRLRGELEEASGPIWGKGVASALADRGMLGMTREIVQLRDALREMHGNYEKALDLELDYAQANNDGETRIANEIDAALYALTRRNEHLLEICGVKHV